ncbi:MAG: sigma-54-dependent Fis family transcriptional regulator [Myxococcales bacterium]|nr:sigma-54-dependent Fis family transcriptional regulator [Myxococcales bacterium]
MPGTVLIVEDDLDTAELVLNGLRKRGFDGTILGSAKACVAWLQTGAADVVITDVVMEGMSGIELCLQLKKSHPDLPVVVMTGSASLETAIAAIRAGAYDYITKPVRMDGIEVVVARAVAHVKLRRELSRLRSESALKAQDHVIIGSSSAVRAVNEMIARVAASDATVLILGESGTGKELVARALHERSDRCAEPFVAVNCAAMPAALLESELFGHVQGAFTDAKRDRPGLFVQAGAGTLFLDEIGEMPIEMQAKLLRVLQERRVRPVGGDGEVPVRARVITATNRNLESAVRDRQFREDLYYRINVVQIAVPPLRERDADALVLAHYFLRRIAHRTGKQVESISVPAACKLLEYDWPGNVRELENCMERAVALCQFTEILVEDLPSKLREHGPVQHVISTVSLQDLVTIDEMARRYVRHVVALSDGNKTHAARLLGIDRRSLYRRLDMPPEQPTEPSTSAADAASECLPE